MDENTESATEKDSVNLNQIVVDAAVHRIKYGEIFSDAELDLLLHISSVDIDRIVAQLVDDESIRFAGLLRDRQEELAAHFSEI